MTSPIDYVQEINGLDCTAQELHRLCAIINKAQREAYNSGIDRATDRAAMIFVKTSGGKRIKAHVNLSTIKALKLK